MSRPRSIADGDFSSELQRRSFRRGPVILMLLSVQMSNMSDLFLYQSTQLALRGL